MQNVYFPLKKKQLVVAISAAILGVSLVGCSSDSGSGGGGGIYTINATGGNALNSTAGDHAGYGGYGGYIDIENEGGTGGVEIRSSGKANASFSSIITTPNADLGDIPFEVMADTTITMPTSYGTTGISTLINTGVASLYVSADGVLRTTDATGTTAAVAADDAAIADASFYIWSNELLVADGAASLATAGTPYLTSASSIYLADGIDNAGNDIATGLSVASDTTLTLEQNSYGGDTTRFNLENDIINDGIITTADENTGNRGDLTMFTQGSYIASGDIDTSADGAFMNGGDVQISAKGIYNSGNINTSGNEGGDAGQIRGYGGFIENNGDLTADGGADTAAAGYGGNGGGIELNAVYLENTGAISSSGGAADADGYGGLANDIRLYGDFGLNNSGDLTANGAEGGYGGNGGYVRLDVNQLGSIRNSGDISTNGANGSNGIGGYGGLIKLYADGGEIISSGDLSATGGDQSDNHYYGSYSGGYGGRIIIQSDDGDFNYDGIDVNQQADNIILSGNIDVSGGDNYAADLTGYGGYGGLIDIYLNQDDDSSEPYMTITDAKVSLLGYTSIDVSGGNGGYGGYGGSIDISTDDEYFSESSSDLGGGPVVNQADLIARGGDAIVVADVTNNASGGYGGWVSIETNGDANSDILTINNKGDIDVSGGSSYNGDVTQYGALGSAGGVYIEGHYGVNNSGDMTLNGGDDVGDNGYGGNAGNVSMVASVGSVVNSGTIEAIGGYGTETGGQAQDAITMVGLKVNNSGDISYNGGDADPAVVDSQGGYAGIIELYAVSIKESDTNNSGTLSVTGGAGETAGEDGCALVGLQEVMIGCSRFLFEGPGPEGP